MLVIVCLSYLLAFSIESSYGFGLRTISYRATTSLLYQMTGNTDPSIALQQKQFDMFSKNQIGKWIGVHTGYDPEDDMVADHMYVESLLEKVEDGIKHYNSFVAGEIRTDCETCFDSERLRTKEVGTYQVRIS